MQAWLRRLTSLLPWLRSPLLIASLIALAHHYVPALAVLDSYSYIAIANLTAVPGPRPPGAVAAVLIDQETYDSRYLERSPLHRCPLVQDLRKVYEAEPTPGLVVIDLDLSPAPLARTSAQEHECEADLDTLLSANGARTILMNPLPITSEEATHVKNMWKADLERKGVRFGNVQIPVQYGLLISQYCDPKSLAALAYLAARSPLAPSNCLTRRAGERTLSLINARHYLSVSPVPLTAADAPPASRVTFDERLSQELRTIQQNARAGGRLVLFFGASYGPDVDVYVTPVGELHGVEVHAASFLSLFDPWSSAHHGWAFLLHVALGVLMSRLLIDRCWENYLDLRKTSNPCRNQAAPLWVVALLSGLALTTFLLSLGSLFLLRSWGVWLSPVGLSLGMLIDSAIGVVHRAGANPDAPRAMQLGEAFGTVLRARSSNHRGAVHLCAAMLFLVWRAAWLGVVLVAVVTLAVDVA